MTKETQGFDVVIVGGGLVGLCVAFHLIGSQRKVGVIQGTHKGRASLAAAGMLAPACEWHPGAPLPFLEFLQNGRDYYKEFLPNVLGGSHSYERVGYTERQFILLDLLENDKGLASRFESLQAVGTAAEWLSREDACKLEPGINPEAIRGGILISGDAEDSS